jgi:hypothetical protein
MIDVGEMIMAMVGMFGDFAQAIPGFPGEKLGAIKKPAGDPAYVGFGVAAQDQAAVAEMFVPVGTVRQVRKMIEPLLGKDD